MLNHLYYLSFQAEIRLDFLLNKCMRPRICTSADLYLNMYITTQLVPTYKGQVAHIIL